MKNEECQQMMKQAAESLSHQSKDISTKIDSLKDQVKYQSDRISSLEDSVSELLLELRRFSSFKNLAIDRETV